MSAIVSNYNKYFTCDGDLNNALNKLEKSLDDIGCKPEWITKAKEKRAMYSENTNDALRKAIDLVSAYFSVFGYTYESKWANFQTPDLAHYLKEKGVFMRFLMPDVLINDVIDEIIADGQLPEICFNSSCTEYSCKFFVEVSEDIISREELIRKGFLTYLYGFPASDIKLMNSIGYYYAHAECLMQPTVFINMTKDKFSDVFVDLHAFGLSVQEWCERVDGIWIDIDIQIPEGFVSIINPEKPSKVVCVSTLYNGEYFITDMNTFKNLYEHNYLTSIRFEDRKVKVLSMPDSKRNRQVKERTIKVPVFNNGDEEMLIDDLLITDFVYDEMKLEYVGEVM